MNTLEHYGDEKAARPVWGLWVASNVVLLVAGFAATQMFFPSLLPQWAIFYHPTGEVRTLQGPENPVASLPFSPDGHTLASEESGSRAIKLWDIAGDRCCARCKATPKTFTR